MLKNRFIVPMLSFALLFASSFAGHTQPAPEATTPEGKTIFSFKKDIGMTDQQEKDLHTILDGFQKYFEEKRTSLISVEKDVSSLVSTKGDLTVIKTKIDELAKLKADVTFKDIETSRKVETVLKPEQIEKWKKIQSEAIEELKKQMATSNSQTAQPAVSAPVESVK